MFAPLTDKVKQKSASSRTLTHGMKRLKKSETFHGSTRIACFSARHSLCCNGRTRQRFSSALCGGRAPAHDRLLAAPLPGQPSASWRRELSLSASSLLQDETTLIVARPAEKIKRRSHEIFLHFSSFGCRNSEKACWCGTPDWNTGCDSRRTYSSGRRPAPSAQTRPR